MRDVICNDTVLFCRPYCGSVVTRTRNVSEYMLVLTVCVVTFVVTFIQSTLSNIDQLTFSKLNHMMWSGHKAAQ